VFDGSHERTTASTSYDPCEHVSQYAATMPSEDFAETFALWVRHAGQLPARFRCSDGVARKWKFIDELAEVIWMGARRW